MKRFSEQLNKKSMTVKLRAAEKRELRERVVSYMEYHPLPKELKTKKVFDTPALMTEPYKVVAVPWKMMTQWAVGAFAIVMIAVPFAAERSVPGDGLYAVKRFNEEVRGTLAFDTIQKVEWETERLNRRISEARLLASEGRLTDEVEEEVAAAVRTHTENAQKNIDVLRGEDADEATLASIAFETTLTVQSAALNDEADDTETPSILASAVEETRVKANASNASSTIPAFDKIMAKVEINTTRVYELRDSLVETATEEDISEITRRIEDIERTVQEALKLRSEDDEEARALLVSSLQRTQKLVVFMTDIEVSNTVDIETIVPVVLTEEEKKVVVAELQSALDEKLLQIEKVSFDEVEEAIAEKAGSIMIEAETILAASSTPDDFVATKTRLSSALDLVNSVYILLQLDQEKTEVIEEEVNVEEEVSSSTEEVASSAEQTIEEETEIEEVEEVEPALVDVSTSTATSTDIEVVNVDTE